MIGIYLSLPYNDNIDIELTFCKQSAINELSRIFNYTMYTVLHLVLRLSAAETPDLQMGPRCENRRESHRGHHLSTVNLSAKLF